MLERFIKDILTYLPSKFLPALTGLITAPILTRLLIPAEYGNWALAIGVSDFLFALACSGIGASVIRFFPAYRTRSELDYFFVSLISTTGLTIIVASLLSFLLLFIFQTKIPATLYPLLIISILIFIVQSVFTIFSEVARAQNRSSLYTWYNLIFYYGSLGLGIFLLVFFKLGVKGLMLGTLAIVVVALPFLLHTTLQGIQLSWRYLRNSDIFELWRYAWPLALGNIAFWGLRISDRYVIGLFRNEAEVGLYSAVYNLSDKTINILVTLFLLSMGPLVHTVWEEQGREATEKTLAMVTRLFLIICLPATIGLSILALPFISIFTGSAYHEGYRIVGYVAFSAFAYGLAQIVSRGTLIAKQSGKVGINFIVSAVVNVGLNVLLIPKYGYIVAGVTTLIGYALLFTLQTISAHPYLTWHFPFITLRNILLASTIMGLTAWGVFLFAGKGNPESVLALFLSVFTGALTYFIALWLLGEVNEEEKLKILQFWNSVTRKETRHKKKT